MISAFGWENRTNCTWFRNIFFSQSSSNTHCPGRTSLAPSQARPKSVAAPAPLVPETIGLSERPSRKKTFQEDPVGPSDPSYLT